MPFSASTTPGPNHFPGLRHRSYSDNDHAETAAFRDIEGTPPIVFPPTCSSLPSSPLHPYWGHVNRRSSLSHDYPTMHRSDQNKDTNVNANIHMHVDGNGNGNGNTNTAVDPDVLHQNDNKNNNHHHHHNDNHDNEVMPRNLALSYSDDHEGGGSASCSWPSVLPTRRKSGGSGIGMMRIGLIRRLLVITIMGGACLVVTSPPPEPAFPNPHLMYQPTPAQQQMQEAAFAGTPNPVSLAHEVTFPYHEDHLAVHVIHNASKRFVPMEPVTTVSTKPVSNDGKDDHVYNKETTTTTTTTTTAAAADAPSEETLATATPTKAGTVIPVAKKPKRPELAYAHKIAAPKFVATSPNLRFVPPNKPPPPPTREDHSKMWLGAILLVLVLDSVYRESFQQLRRRRRSSLRTL